MGNPSDWLDTGYDQLAIAGIPVVAQRRVLNLVAGATVADNTTTEQTDVTIVGEGSAAPSAATVVTSNTVLASPSTNQVFVVNSSSAISVSVTGTPVDGVVLTFIDGTQNWPAYRFSFAAQSGALVRNPENVAAADASSVTVGAVAGETVSWKWVQASSKWLSL
jgi:hypothetical protein